MQVQTPYQKHTYLALTKIFLHYQLTFLYCKATERQTFEKCVSCKIKLKLMYFTSNPVSQANRQKTIKVFYFTTCPVSQERIEKKSAWKNESTKDTKQNSSTSLSTQTCMKKSYGSTKKTKKESSSSLSTQFLRQEDKKICAWKKKW